MKQRCSRKYRTMGIRFILTMLMTGMLIPFSYGQSKTGEAPTVVRILIPEKKQKIDPMIYGQMLENVNDSMIYGGIADLRGNERLHVTEKLKTLRIPVMRWPGGTVIHEYRWKNGIGPREKRPVLETFAWKGTENYQFGTDEFLQWCQRVGTAPYINFNMGNDPVHQGTLQEALDWVEYVNGPVSSPYGRLRAENGHPEPYGVRYWCIGNENYGPWGRHGGETADQYAIKLQVWAQMIKGRHPDLSLLAVGRTAGWNDTVLQKTGEYLDFLTQHYYGASRVKDGIAESPENILFAPVKMEVHLEKLEEGLAAANKRLGRADTNPIRVSIDEWNNRHSVYNGTEYQLNRQAPRRQLDAAVVAGMLNVFIRQCHTVGMANYIFPVNSHGLIRTVGNHDVYETPLFQVFKQYRDWMTGSRLESVVEGPGVPAEQLEPAITGDCDEVRLREGSLPYIDAAAVQDDGGDIVLSLVNRSADKILRVEVELPDRYVISETWSQSHPNIFATNTAEDRNVARPRSEKLKARKGKVHIPVPACGIYLLRLKPSIG